MKERLARLAATALRVWLIVGILLRVTRLRDRFDPLALVYYTTPWPMIAAGLAVLAAHHWRLGNKHRVRRYVLLTAGAIFVWVALGWHSQPETAGVPHLRVVLWNVSRPDALLPRAAAWLRKQDADVIALAEAHPNDGSNLQRWQGEFLSYRIADLPANMLCLVRGEILDANSGSLDGNSSYGRLRVRVRGREFILVQADLMARPLASRRKPLAELADLLQRDLKQPLIVLGDFNTPSDSAHFDRFRRSLTNCATAAGKGFAETWPLPLPVLTLDQIWISPALRPLKFRAGGALLSDHRPVVAEIAFAN